MPEGERRDPSPDELLGTNSGAKAAAFGILEPAFKKQAVDTNAPTLVL